MARDKAGKYRSVRRMNDIYASNNCTTLVSTEQEHSFCSWWGRNMPAAVGHNNGAAAEAHNILVNSHSRNNGCGDESRQ